MEYHYNLVASISAQVRDFYNAGVPFRIYHGSTNSTRTVARDLATSVDISMLNNIISIDQARRIASVEPNVPMDRLVEACLQHNLIPPVVPEFPGITVGGGFAGSAGESSSFKYGFLDACVLRVEVVLGNGTVREVAVDGGEEEEELLKALSGSLGTLGVLTRLDIALIDAKPYVELTYRPVHTFEEAKKVIEYAMQKTAGNHFVDGIMFSATQGAIVTGKMVADTCGGRITRFSRAEDEWCFLHVQAMVSQPRQPHFLSDAKVLLGENADLSAPATPPAVDYVPLTDYLFRYDRGAFWMGKYGCKHFCLPFTKTIRTLLDCLFHTREMYTALHASKMQQHHIVEDLAVPFDQTVPFLDYLESDFSIYPLWLCPLKFQATGLTLKHLPRDTDMMLNVGVWGPWDKKHKSFKEANLALEHFVKNKRGVKWLYAQTFYTEGEFWDIYDREKYERLRIKYSATSLPNVYDKVKQPDQQKVRTSTLSALWELVFGFWLVGGLYGLFQAWRRAQYVLKK
ncbi:FAD binding domain-containing protein [Lophiostoma macrostomum CBS 122681]|uniref:Delta(24)-sterol reductase n=1 Tax=Lophiostoma macrostomum CBS 122681 TaxID=1314788 RepID=A0A6A6SMA5_9PLEO|nr:FAD binding domain-containing protein [Lophiostoma macrostomum CBS 122681]